MALTTRELLEQVESWPEEDQEELAEYAREIEARRTGVYNASAKELAAIDEALGQVARGETVTGIRDLLGQPGAEDIEFDPPRFGTGATPG